VGRRLGLLVGINNYQDPTFRPLQYAETDAKAFAQWLVDTRGGNWNPSDVHVTTGMDSTKEQLEAHLIQLCVHAAEPGDLILVYFAGHAFLDEASGTGYLAGSNTIYQQPTSALSLLSLTQQVMGSSRASQIVLMLDCFQTGSAWNRRRSGPFDYQPLIGPALQQSLQQSQGQGRILYCICRGNDLAPEVGEKGLGSALYRTIISLSGLAKDPSAGQITLQQLHTYLTRKTDAQHRPQIFGQESRPIVLLGDLPYLAPAYAMDQSAYAVSSSAATRTSTAPSGQVTFQGVGESGPLVDLPSQHAGTATTGQLSPPGSSSGQLSLSLMEQNRQQQCIKLLQQARQSLLMQNFPQAMDLTQQVLQMNPTFVDALTLKSQILGSTGQFQEALVAVEQLLQVEPHNALVWSMRAALLSNMGRTMEALSAIERSLVLNPQNPETQAMRESIQANLARLPDNTWQPPNTTPQPLATPVRDNAKSFLLTAALQIFAFIIGSAGAALLVLQPHLPIITGFLLESFGLALLCIIAARGSFLYGVGRLIFSILLCLVAAAMLGGIYKFGYTWLINKLIASPPLIVPMLFLAFWLVAAVIAPFLFGLGGFIGGIAVGVRRKGRNRRSEQPASSPY